MKLISLNVGIKIDNTKEVTKLLANENPDIVGLQESVRPFDKNVFANHRIGQELKTVLSDKLPYEFFAPIYYTNSITKNGNKYFDFGGFIEQGTQIITKFPIISASNSFYYNEYAYGFDATEFKEKDWTRSILVSTLNINDQAVKIINVHGIWNATRMGDERTIKQSMHILKHALSDNLPVIIIGDFNLLPNSESIELINKKFNNLSAKYNIKSTRPEFDDGLDKGNMVVDYIFVNDKIKVNDFKVINSQISDHYPLILDFDIIK